jgi:hypothetical protein
LLVEYLASIGERAKPGGPSLSKEEPAQELMREPMIADFIRCSVFGINEDSYGC